MSTLNTGHSEYHSPNPVDLAEELASVNDWQLERQGEDELTIFIGGQYTDFQFRLMWREDYKTLQFACLFDLKVPEGRTKDIYQTIGLLNERLWLGHFEFWEDEGILLFRHASLANDPMIGHISEDHLAAVVETAVSECERFFPVFQFVMWGGQNPADAIEAAMLDCVGTA